MVSASIRRRLAEPETRRVLSAAAGGALLIVVLATAAHTWWTGWSGRLWLTAVAVSAAALAIFLARRRPRAILWVGIVAFGLLLIVPAYLHGTNGGGLRVVGLHFDDVVAGLFLVALALAVWRLASVPILPLWGRWVVVGLGAHAAVPVAMGLLERIPFGEVLVGLWTLPYWLQGAYFGAAILLPVALVISLLGLFLRPLRPLGAVAQDRRATVALALFLSAITLICAFEMNSRKLSNALTFLPSSTGSSTALVEVPADREPLGSVSVSADRRQASAPQPELPTAHIETGEEAGWREIFAQVRDEIGFEPSRSHLRSPRGVVLNGRGSSLEQARLLASRLTAAGASVRFVEGSLKRERASALIASTLPLESRLTYPETVPISRPTEDASLLRLLESHYWVQLQRSGEWLDLDPSFAGAEPGTRFGQPRRTWDRLPDELFPTVSLAVEIERLESPGHLEPLLNWEGQFAELANVAVDLVIVARIEAESKAEEAEPASGLDVFGALGGKAAGPEDDSRAKTTIYEASLTLDEATLAQGAFRVGGGPRDEVASDAVGRIDLRIKIRHPDGRRREVLRPLFEADETSHRPPLFQRHSLLITASRIPESWFRQQLDLTLAERDAEAVRERLDYLEQSLRGDGDLAEIYQEAVSLERSLGPGSGHLMNLAFAATSDRLATQLGRELEVFAYYDEPRILITTFQGSGEELEVFLDLRQDSCAAISYPGQARLMRESFLYGRGVLESILEAKVVELFTRQRPLSTAGLMQKAAAEGVPIVMYSKRERSRVAELGLPPSARQRVLATLDAGKIVVLPTHGVDHAGKTRWGWWQVEPATREAVGVLDTGLHQATVQRTLIESEGALDEDMAWAIGAITGATDTHWVLAALILEYGELDKAALQEAKAYLKQIGEYLCKEIKVGKVWKEGTTVAEVKAEIEGCWEEGYSLSLEGSVGGEVTILDKGWCEGFQKGFTCASMSILNGYLSGV